MKTAVVKVLLIFAAVCSVAVAGDTGPAMRRVKLPDNGALDLPAPPAWRVEANRPLAFLPPTIEFSPAEGKAFSILITVLTGADNDPHFNEPKSVSRTVAKARDKAVDSATSRHIPILELKGERLFGYYFSATDRSPEPDGWKYMTHGSAALEDLLLTFTIFSNDPKQPEVEPTLAMLRQAKRVKP
jgi:hypothetical protein